MTQVVPKSPREVFLTANQRDIVERLSRGDRAPAIAGETKRSVDTVRQTLRAIYAQCGVRSAEELIAGLGDRTLKILPSKQTNPQHDLRSGITAIERALTNMRTENARKGTSRRRAAVRLHENEMDAILIAHGEIGDGY